MTGNPGPGGNGTDGGNGGDGSDGQDGSPAPPVHAWIRLESSTKPLLQIKVSGGSRESLYIVDPSGGSLKVLANGGAGGRGGSGGRGGVVAAPVVAGFPAGFNGTDGRPWLGRSRGGRRRSGRHDHSIGRPRCPTLRELYHLAKPRRRRRKWSSSNYYGGACPRALVGISGNTTWEGRLESMYTVFRATRRTSPVPSGAPVLGFTSKCGKLLDETSSRIR